MVPNIKKVLGTGFYWQTVVEDVDGKIWEGVFDYLTKKTEWKMK
jgi:hypothetical protein